VRPSLLIAIASQFAVGSSVMKLQLLENGVWTGDRPAGEQALCSSDWAVINTSKHPHATLVVVSPKQLKGHRHYSRLEKEGILSFDWVDGPADLYRWHGPEVFVRIPSWCSPRVSRLRSRRRT
jgi:hypothetical protein